MYGIHNEGKLELHFKNLSTAVKLLCKLTLQITGVLQYTK